MKKTFIILTILATTFFLTACGTEEKKEDNKSEIKEMVCTLSADVDENTSMESTYKVKYQDDKVLSVDSTEKITSSNKEILETYKTTVDSMYSSFDNIKGYNYETKIEGDSFISTVKANYEVIDLDKFIEKDESTKLLMKDGHISLEVLKSSYEALTATCK